MNRTEITKEKSKDGSESITYRKNWSKGGLNYCKEVRKVEGGYIIRESKYGKPEEEDSEYVDETKEYVSIENPFKAKEEKPEEDANMFDFIDNPTF